MNSIVISGRLTKDVELRYTSTTNKEVAGFTVAVNRRFDKDKADFINCTAWGKTADVISKFFSKGKMITVHGELRIDAYDKEDGTRAYKTYINVDNFSFCGDSNGGNNTSSNTGNNTNKNDDEGFYPIDDSEEELPF